MEINAWREYIKRNFYLLTCIFFLLLGGIYVVNTWSPSSYAIVLKQLHVKHNGLVVGEPKTIRSDEWTVLTPLTQATVNNNFERYNQTSVYQEDLRINYGLPIKDWGIIFKPTMWLYLFANPAYAYSLHWYMLFVLFIMGYAILFKIFGVSKLHSLLLSVGLYFTGFVQFWWSVNGPSFALFPWVIIILLSQLPIAVRLLLFYWISVSWLTTNFYPPFFISLAFVGGLIVLARGQEWLSVKKIISLGLVSVLAALTSALYLKDYLLKTMTTLYPGSRSFGGGSVLKREWISQLFPYSTFDLHYHNLVGFNICEAGTVGIFFVLLAFCYINYSKSKFILQEIKKDLSILGIGLLAMTAWMLFPLPAWVGMPLLWNNVSPERMEYAAGFLLVLLISVIYSRSEIKITWLRTILFSSLVILAWYGFKVARGYGIFNNVHDLVVLPILYVMLFFIGKGWIHPKTSLLLTSTLTGFFVLAPFNPIQSAWPIFNRESTPIYILFNEQVRQKDGVLAIKGFDGATLNGLGYRSISHVAAVPALEFWRQQYPAMPEKEFNEIFNRYARISLIDSNEPKLLYPDHIGVPLSDFADPDILSFNYGQDKGEVLWLKPGETLNGRIRQLGKSGTISSFAVMIGNCIYTSDGTLNLKVCVSNECATAYMRLSDTIDNDYVYFNLNKPLKIEESSLITYQLSLSRDAQKNTAIYVFPAVFPINPVREDKVKNLSYAPKIKLKYIK